MNDIEQEKISQLVKQLQNAIDNSGGKFNPPAWMLDKTRPGDTPLTQEEVFEFAEFQTRQLRNTAALYYLNHCTERFGFNDKGQNVFCAPGLIVEIDQQVIEVLLIHQIERYLIEERPEDKYLTPMRFYMGDEIKRKENGSTWLIDFIDDVFISGAKELASTFGNNGITFH
ncbi:hypothetical protein NG99_17030 [Erwinia typographi]|uniref:Uncharacterized protein n=1 Tax=Erwinia typographi TaxID=371042 RepID=A0A0A3Z0H6_9GAMM|nr:hypothetical protein [Erwinia typographi]KGT91269.1 hypothetical protein NG99_17030 [Erwinia typographi]